MARTKAVIRHLRPDLRYHSVEVTKLIHYVMRKGKKNLAISIVYDSFDLIKSKMDMEPLEVFKKAMEQVTPKVEVRSRRIGGTNIQIPIDVRRSRQQQLCLRWLVNAASSRKGKSMAICLSNEIMDASKGEGMAFKKKKDVHKAAQAHKTYAHLR